MSENLKKNLDDGAESTQQVTAGSVSFYLKNVLQHAERVNNIMASKSLSRVHGMFTKCDFVDVEKLCFFLFEISI